MNKIINLNRTNHLIEVRLLFDSRKLNECIQYIEENKQNIMNEKSDFEQIYIYKLKCYFELGNYFRAKLTFSKYLNNTDDSEVLKIISCIEAVECEEYIANYQYYTKVFKIYNNDINKMQEIFEKFKDDEILKDIFSKDLTKIQSTNSRLKKLYFDALYYVDVFTDKRHEEVDQNLLAYFFINTNPFMPYYFNSNFIQEINSALDDKYIDLIKMSLFINFYYDFTNLEEINGVTGWDLNFKLKDVRDLLLAYDYTTIVLDYNLYTISYHNSAMKLLLLISGTFDSNVNAKELAAYFIYTYTTKYKEFTRPNIENEAYRVTGIKKDELKYGQDAYNVVQKKYNLI